MAEKTEDKKVEKTKDTERKPTKKMEKKLKGKLWFTVLAPALFDNVEIGKTVSYTPDSVVGRKINVSLMELTNNFSKYYMKLTFRIIEVKGEQALTEFTGSECMRDYITRMVYHYSRRVDAVQDLQTKDGKKIRVKTIAILPKRAKSSIQASARNKIIEIIKAEVEGSSLDEFIEKMLTDEIRSKVLADVRKIYPVRNFEIRKTEIIKK